jgi:hypothetical protein
VETFVNTLLASAIAWTCVMSAASVSGQVAAQDGGRLSGVRVFLEPGLGGALIEAHADTEGRFSFDNVPAGLCGVFAIADGLGWGGVSRNATSSEDIADVRITLQSQGQIGGRAVDAKGAPVKGALVSRVLLLGDSKVGISLSKLAAFGFPDPVSGTDGRFTVSRLPGRGHVALKIDHPAYALTVVSDLAVGSGDVKVTLSPGILVQGTVLSRDGSTAVSNAAILFQRATPPHETAVTTSDIMGEFRLRLDPGYYAYQAAGLDLRSPGWQKLGVTGREPVQRVTLRVSATARFRGEVRDAASGGPVQGARLTLMTYGNPAASIMTDENGGYELMGTEGENVITLEPAPGYQRPERPALTLQAKQGDDVELPMFWLTRLPAYRLQVVDAAGNPAPRALIRLIRPAQMGWQVAGPDGRIELHISGDPPGGKLVGLAEHPTRPEGALFALTPRDATGARVQMLPLATVSGSVLNTKSKGIAGVVVGALFQTDDNDEPLPLWRTVTDTRGSFDWPCVAPYVPTVCLARAGPEAYGRSAPFNAEAGAHVELRPITIEAPDLGAKSAKPTSYLGKRLPWFEEKVLGGALPTPSERASKSALVVYCQADEAAATIEAVHAVRETMGGLVAAVLVDGAYQPNDLGKSLTDPPVPVLQGRAPNDLPKSFSGATSYVLNAGGTVVLECIGLPPAVAFQNARTDEGG